MVKRILMAVLGTVFVYAVWTVTGRLKHGGSGEVSSIPQKVWSGGTDVTLNVELSHPGTVRTSFYRGDGKEPANALHAYQRVSAGHHTFVIAVPPDVSGRVEVGLEKPPVGAKAHVELKAAGRAPSDDDELTEALDDRHAFFVDLDIDDWATAKVEGADPANNEE